MKIAVSGTHGVGKTTLVNELIKLDELKDYFIDNNVTRWVNTIGFNINEGTSGIGQEINLLKRIAHLNSYRNIIADRSIIDVLAYSAHGSKAGTVSQESFVYQLDLYSRNAYKYDIIFVIHPEFDIEDDGVRATNPEFQKWIEEYIDVSIDIMQDVYPPEMMTTQFVYLTGSVEERVEQARQAINEFTPG